MANYSRNGGRGGTRAVDGRRVMPPWADMKANKRESARRLRRMSKTLCRG